MSIGYKVSQDGMLIEAFPKGVLDIKKTIGYFDSLQHDNRIKNDAVEIVDLNNVADFNISYIESREITEKYQEPKESKRIKSTIFLCEKDLAYGIGRMLQTYHEITNPKHNVMIVRSKIELMNRIKKIKETDNH